jgi:hypothetical protein
MPSEPLSRTSPTDGRSGRRFAIQGYPAPAAIGRWQALMELAQEGEFNVVIHAIDRFLQRSQWITCVAQLVLAKTPYAIDLLQIAPAICVHAYVTVSLLDRSGTRHRKKLMRVRSFEPASTFGPNLVMQFAKPLYFSGLYAYFVTRAGATGIQPS